MIAQWLLTNNELAGINDQVTKSTTLGRPDRQVTVDQVLEMAMGCHVQKLLQA